MHSLQAKGKVVVCVEIFFQVALLNLFERKLSQ